MSDLHFRPATHEDIDSLVALEEAVERALPHRDMFAIDGREFYEPIVAGGGHILLADDSEGRLAGVSVIRFPEADDEENLGRELDLPESQLLRVRHLESVFVRPDCQGRKLAERLIRENMRLTTDAGRPISCATVWPLNIPSLRLHLELGLFIRAFAFKYGGKPRFVLADDGQRPEFGPAVTISYKDVEAQRELLARGFWGTALYRSRGESDDFVVEYRQPVR